MYLKLLSVKEVAKTYLHVKCQHKKYFLWFFILFLVQRTKVRGSLTFCMYIFSTFTMDSKLASNSAFFLWPYCIFSTIIFVDHIITVEPLKPNAQEMAQKLIFKMCIISSFSKKFEIVVAVWNNYVNRIRFPGSDSLEPILKIKKTSWHYNFWWKLL